ncbi:MAG TPA: SH3 domain-containing protein [Spirochaetia bacterium]|nr:SH3 domain-containing protein [Spirochaetia bacterium]
MKLSTRAGRGDAGRKAGGRGDAGLRTAGLRAAALVLALLAGAGGAAGAQAPAQAAGQGGAGKAAAAKRPEVRIVESPEARLRSAASATSRLVAKLEPGESVLVLETAAKAEKLGGVTAPWLRVAKASGEEGWAFGGWLAKAPARGYYKRGELPEGADYDAYLALALRRGERVVAAEDAERVSAGEKGWAWGRVDGDPPFLVVWDRDLGGTPLDEYLPEGLPRILDTRIYFVYAESLEILGEAATADFAALGLETVAERAGEFGVGAAVTLGRHYAVGEDEESANWAEEMEDYVGSVAFIEELLGEDDWGRPLALVDADGGEWAWRIENMRLDTGESYSDEYGDEYRDEEDYDGDYGADADAESYGMIAEGSLVVLGRHDELGGDPNWNEDMAEFVGKKAKVAELAGSDGSGFLGVRVEGNDWFWRARNLAMVGRGQAGSYGWRVGDEVILGRHREIEGSSNWAEEMEAYVGMRATITALLGPEGDSAGCFLVSVDADGGEWSWRAENLLPAD